jgi:Calcineurin-like phosphoesterase superfamily domain
MRLALLADIHGNLPAFEAALAHVKTQSVDQILILGDIVNTAPDSKACWDLACSLSVPILRGNHERYLADWEKPESPPEWKSERFATTQWASRQFSRAELGTMRDLPIALRLPEFPDTVFCHASTRDDYDQVVGFTTESELCERFPNLSENWVFRGHNHHQMVRLWGEKTIITVGATGLPLDMNPVAQYAIIVRKPGGGWHFTHHAVPYDLDQLRARFRDSNYLAEAGPMARLCYREAITGCSHILPFIRAYARMGDIPLATAVSRYLQDETHV